MAGDQREHWHGERGDAWRPKWCAQRAHGFQSLPKWDTYSDTNAQSNTESDLQCDAYGYTATYSDAQASRDTETTSDTAASPVILFRA